MPHRERLARFEGDPGLTDVRQTGTIAALDLRVSRSGYLADVGPKPRAFFRRKELLIRPLGNVIGGGLIAAIGACGNVYSWYTMLDEGHFYGQASMLVPAFFVLGVALILFPGYREERLARGEDISGLKEWHLLTPRWRWVCRDVRRGDRQRRAPLRDGAGMARSHYCRPGEFCGLVALSCFSRATASLLPASAAFRYHQMAAAASPVMPSTPTRRRINGS